MKALPRPVIGRRRFRDELLLSAAKGFGQGLGMGMVVVIVVLLAMLMERMP